MVLKSVVFDVNILISAYLRTQGAPGRCVALAEKDQVASITSKTILHTLENKLRKKFNADETSIRRTVQGIEHMSRIVEPTTLNEPITSDAEDDRVLATAMAGQADYLVTGDRRHLLPLKAFRGIRIITAREFLVEIGA